MKHVAILAVTVALCLVMLTIAVHRLTEALDKIEAENKCIAAHIAAGQARADILECTTHEEFYNV